MLVEESTITEFKSYFNNIDSCELGSEAVGHLAKSDWPHLQILKLCNTIIMKPTTS